MGSSSREKGVLKLVHPGRHIEYHKEPITAAEVMKRNPRHCVTRPDVFKCPWIVVRPESLLMPGKVFYIVPNLTIYQLLKARGLLTQQATENQSPNKRHDHSCIRRKNLPFKSTAGMTPMHISGNMSQVGVSFEEEDSNGSFLNTSHAKQNVNINTNSEWPVDSVDNIGYCQPIESGHTRPNNASPWFKSKNGDQEITSCENAVKLKSCIRKEDSIRRWLKLRVTFNFSTTKTRGIELPSLQQQD